VNDKKTPTFPEHPRTVGGISPLERNYFLRRTVLRFFAVFFAVFFFVARFAFFFAGMMEEGKEI